MLEEVEITDRLDQLRSRLLRIKDGSSVPSLQTFLRVVVNAEVVPFEATPAL